jgi:hypothetical protein
MIWLMQLRSWSSADTQLQADILKVLAVFGGAGLLIFILFAAQLFLIHRIEQRARRKRGPAR